MADYRTYREEMAAVCQIIERYRLDLTLLTYMKQANYYPEVHQVIHDSRRNGYEHYLNNQIYKKTMIEQRVLQFEAAMKMIGPQYERIITREFINGEHGWWLDYYGRSTFYRHKKKAVKAFLKAIDELVLLE